MSKSLIHKLKEAFTAKNVSDKKANELIQAIQTSSETITFFKKDKEMCIKYPDIWKMQMDNEEKNYESLRHHLIEYGSRNQIDIESIFKAEEDANQLLDDIIDKE